MWKTCCLALALSAAAPADAATPSPAPMTPIDFVEMPRLHDPALSSDGTMLAFVRSHTDWKNNAIIDRLYIKGTGDTSARPAFTVQTEKENQGRAFWSPDSRHFLTVLKRKGDDHKQAYLVTPQTGAIERLTDQPEGVEDPIWAPDGASFFFLSQQSLDKKTEALRKGEFLIPEYETRMPKRLWRFELATRKGSEIIGGAYFIREYSLSRDGRSILYLRASGGLIDAGFGEDIPNGEVWLHDLTTGQARRLTDNGYTETRAQLAPDGRRFAFIASVDDEGDSYYESNLFVQAVGETKPRLLMPDEKIEVLDFAWDAKGGGLFVLGNIGLRTELFYYDLQRNALRRLTEGDHALVDWSYDPRSGSHVVLVSSAANPGEIYRIDPGAGARRPLRPLTSEYSDWPIRFKLPRQEGVRWQSRDGQQVEGLLAYPVGYRAGDRFPLVTVSHGGPRSSAQFGNWEPTRLVSVLAGQGYGVLLPNYRGSTGYGDAFMRDMVGGYFKNADLDVLAGVDALIGRGLADPDRLIAMGWSAGGHMTNKLITETGRFKAASSGAGAADWLSMVGQSDVWMSRTPQFGGAPWQQHAPVQVYRDQSVIQNAWKVTTPTVFYAGEDDRRVPSNQGLLMYRGVKAAGVPTELYLAKGEPHNFRKPSNQLFKIQTDLAWFARYLGREPYTPSYPNGAAEKGEAK